MKTISLRQFAVGLAAAVSVAAAGMFILPHWPRAPRLGLIEAIEGDNVEKQIRYELRPDYHHGRLVVTARSIVPDDDGAAGRADIEPRQPGAGWFQVADERYALARIDDRQGGVMLRGEVPLGAVTPGSHLILHVVDEDGKLVFHDSTTLQW